MGMIAYYALVGVHVFLPFHFIDVITVRLLARLIALGTGIDDFAVAELVKMRNRAEPILMRLAGDRQSHESYEAVALAMLRAMR